MIYIYSFSHCISKDDVIRAVKNKLRSHLVTIAPMAPFTPKSISKLRSALHFKCSKVIPRFIPRANTAQS